MLFWRNIYSKLLAWKNTSGSRKALLIEGAGRVGKTTIAEAFAKKEYRSYIRIDFSQSSEEVKACFQHMTDPDTFYMLLSAYCGVRLYPGSSLLIFDEVQRFPKARESVRFLTADSRCDILEIGSLICVEENTKGISIPAQEELLRMYPMDFEEFCRALGEDALIRNIRTCFQKMEPVEKTRHDRAMLLFRQYMLVGGMPESLSAFLLGQKDPLSPDPAKRKILAQYQNDIQNIRPHYRTKTAAIFEQLPSLLSRQEKRVVFNRITEGSTVEQYRRAFFWLSDSMIVNNCQRIDDPHAGLALTASDSCIKCYMADTGLLVSHAFDENALLTGELCRKILTGSLGLNRCMLYENAIAQILAANNHRLYYYTHYDEVQRHNDIAIDFMIADQGRANYRITPIEVKSGPHYSDASLMRFRQLYKDRIGCCYIIHPRNLAVKDGYICIPPYMAICL